MTFALVIASLLLALLLATAGFVQLLYLESLRLRTRELPAMEFFKDKLEERLRLKPEKGALSFSIIKQTALLLFGICMFWLFQTSATTVWQTVLQVCFVAWFVMIVLSYIVPQLLYRHTCAEWLLPLAPALSVMAVMAKPVVGVMEFFHSLVELAGEKRRPQQPPTATENIEALISAGAEGGLITEDDRELLQSVVEFGDKTVRHVMTPRPDMVTISADASLEDLRKLVIHERYSRIPVFEESIDQIIGFVHVRDMFELDPKESAHRKVRELMRPISFVPETKPVSDLMREMQAAGTHMVIVVDEYGNTAGLTTLEDLVEVILGEIRDEHEPVSDVTEDGQGGYIVAGSFDVSRLDDMLGFRPPEDTESTTVGGLVTEWLGRVPQPGESVERDRIRIEVLASNELRVEQVRLRKAQAVAHE